MKANNHSTELITRGGFRRYIHEHPYTELIDHMSPIRIAYEYLVLPTHKIPDQVVSDLKMVLFNQLGLLIPDRRKETTGYLLHPVVSDAIVHAAEVLNAQEVVAIAKHSSVLFHNYEFVARLNDFSGLTIELVRSVTDPHNCFSLLCFPRAVKTLRTKVLLAVMEQVEFELSSEELARLIEHRGLVNMLQDAEFVADYRAIQLFAQFPNLVYSAMQDGIKSQTGQAEERTDGEVGNMKKKATSKAKGKAATAKKSASPMDASTILKRMVSADKLIQKVTAAGIEDSTAIIYDILRYVIITEAQIGDAMQHMERIYSIMAMKESNFEICPQEAKQQWQDTRPEEFSSRAEGIAASVLHIMHERKKLLDAVKKNKTLGKNNEALLELMQVPLMTLARDSILTAFNDIKQGADPKFLCVEDIALACPETNNRVISGRNEKVWTLMWRFILQSPDMHDNLPYDLDAVDKCVRLGPEMLLLSWMKLTNRSVRLHSGNLALILMHLVVYTARDMPSSEKLANACILLVRKFVHVFLPSWVVPCLQATWPNNERIRNLSETAENANRPEWVFLTHLRALMKEVLVSKDLFDKGGCSFEQWKAMQDAIVKTRNHLARQDPIKLVPFSLSFIAADSDMKRALCYFPSLISAEMIASMVKCEEGRAFIKENTLFAYGLPSYAAFSEENLRELVPACDEMKRGLYTIPKSVILTYLKTGKSLVGSPAAFLEQLLDIVIPDPEWDDAMAELISRSVFECVLHDPETVVLKLAADFPNSLDRGRLSGQMTAGDVIVAVAKWAVNWELSLYRLCVETFTSAHLSSDSLAKLLQTEAVIRAGIVAHLENWIHGTETELTDDERADMNRLVVIVSAGPVSVGRANFMMDCAKEHCGMVDDTIVFKHDIIYAIYELLKTSGCRNSNWDRAGYCASILINMEGLERILTTRIVSDGELSLWKIRTWIVTLVTDGKLRRMRSEPVPLEWIRNVFEKNAFVPACDVTSLHRVLTHLNAWGWLNDSTLTHLTQDTAAVEDKKV